MYKYKKISVHGRKIDEHRYVMEQHIGRYLQTHEVVRHRNNDTKDNRIENLYLINRKLQPYTQMAEGTYRAFDHKDTKKSNMICSVKFGKRVMIMDISGNELMIVRSIKVAALCVKSNKSRVQCVINGTRNHTKGFRFKLADSSLITF